MFLSELFKHKRWRITCGSFFLCTFFIKGPHLSTQLFNPSEAKAEVEDTSYVFDNIIYQELAWDALIPKGFTADQIWAKYEPIFAQMEDDSEEADTLYAQMMTEFNSAPANDELNEALVKLPGFIAPLEISDEFITEFLLVPYLGACIHMPPPPANQTVLVKTAEGYGIDVKNANNPVWIMGTLTVERATTELAEVGYYMTDAIIESYSDMY